MRDSVTFNRYVDIAGTVTTFTDDVIFEPARETDGLSKFQVVVGLGALDVARIPINNRLIYQIQKWIRERPKKEAEEGEVCRTKPVKDKTPTIAELDEENKGKLKDIEESESFSNILQNELKNEKERLIKETFNKMVDYADDYPDTLVNKIFVDAYKNKTTTFRQIMRSYGFTKKNLKKVDIKPMGEICLCILHYYCPITEMDVPVTFELKKDYDSTLPYYRIVRLINAKETFFLLGENTDEQVKGLVKAGLTGLSFKSALDETKQLLKRIRKRAK